METPKKFYSLEMRFEEWRVFIVHIKGAPGFTHFPFSFQASISKIDYEGHGTVVTVGYGTTIFQSLIDLRNFVTKTLIQEDKDAALLVLSQALAVLNVTSEHAILMEKARLN